MAGQLGIPPDQAADIAGNQNAIGELNARLEQQEAETFAGLWIEYKPQYRVVVAFTKNGESTMSRYVKNTSLESLIDVRKAKRSLADLRHEQEQLISLLHELALSFSSAIIVQENLVELNVTDRALLDAELVKAGRALPPDVRLVVIYEPLPAPPVPLTPPPSLAMPQLRARSAAFMMALATGPLEVKDGCLRVGDHLVIWQPDYFLNDNHGTIEIIDRSGKVAARVGAETQMSGGEIPLNDELTRQLRTPIPDRCTGPYWLMGEIESAR
ncbi:MAG: hypothetical protein ACM3JD_12530 [Rudaea sp.]